MNKSESQLILNIKNCDLFIARKTIRGQDFPIRGSVGYYSTTWTRNFEIHITATHIHLFFK